MEPIYELAEHLEATVATNCAQLTEITKPVEDNVIVPVTDVTFPFNDINVALDRLGEGRAKGKIVVDMR